MPVSPQDFATWSNLTGNPYPQTPAERMALAPEVYQFTRGIGRRGGYGMSPVRKAVDVIGKAALGAGLLAGAAYLGVGGYKRLKLDDEPDISQPTDSTGPTDSIVPVRVVDMSSQTTAENYNQNVVPLQTRIAGLLRGVSPAKPTIVDSEEKPATQSHVISSSQTFSPGNEIEQLTKVEVPHTPVRDRADELIAEFLGGVAAEERAQKRIDQSVAEYAASVAGRGEPVLKSVLAEGRAEGVSPAGTRIQRAAQKKAAEAFRQTPEYAEMMKSAGASMEPESSPVYFTEVHATPETRITGAKPGSAESAFIEMVRPQAEPEADKVTAPVAVASPVQVRRTAEADEAEQLARKYLGITPRGQAVSIVKTEQPAVIETVQATPTRVAKEGKITPNEFLSAMSQQQGPLAAYPISPERSKAVSNLAFYPGGEMGVTMMSRGKPKEFVYATSDPYRLAMRDYAEEGYPESMGNIGGIAADRGLAHQMGLQQAVNPGGTIRQERQPIYTGLMSDADIMAAGMGKPSKTRDRAMEVAQRHFETKEMLKEFSSKYPQPIMSPEEKARLRAERTPIAVAGYRTGLS